MNLYRVISKPIRLHAGKLKLNENQLAPRKHLLSPEAGDVFEIISPVEFKVGELIGYDGEVNKALLQGLEPIILKAEAIEPAPVSEEAAPKPAETAAGKKWGKKAK